MYIELGPPVTNIGLPVPAALQIVVVGMCV